ncbi:MAG: 30S ribosomal protein S10, partial [Minisyncoccia bacterium]
MATKQTKKVTEKSPKKTPKVVKAAPKVPKPKVPKTPKAPKVEETASRLRIRVRAYESKILDLSVKQIIDTALRYDAKVQGPIPLPTEIKKYTV